MRATVLTAPGADGPGPRPRTCPARIWCPASWPPRTSSGRAGSQQALQATRPGGHLGHVGVSHNLALDGTELFFSHVHLHGGPAPVRRFLPDLIERIWTGRIHPGRVFDLELPLDEAAAGYGRRTAATRSRFCCVPVRVGNWNR